MIVKLSGQRWIWVYAAAVVVWVVTVSAAGRGLVSTVIAAATVAAYLAIVGVGQMFVITSGSGNIDLSIAYVMTFCGFVGLRVMGGDNALLVPGLLVAAACGLVVGLVNALSIRLLRIPPIVATLSVGFVLLSGSQVLAHQGSFAPSPGLAGFTSARVLGIPWIVLVGVAVAGLAAVVLHRTAYGRRLQATGQSEPAAVLAGIRTGRVGGSTYLISGGSAGVAGVLLASYAGGAAVDLATTYQLGSIIVVVLGGSLISGGVSNVSGIWGAALFLTLLVTMLNVLHVSTAWQFIVEGLLIIAVLAAANPRSEGTTVGRGPRRG
ncbi:ABC transporter permease [Phytohabitans flavus]|uniref:ABC transporter permease n=1 Tax=Phytohabitans flavus TaxID=1076124 RepID=A0A6F8XWE5_9ACTN|nr:ABC transporter permease [Phytohabitans flavus]BCB78156.1 ABC transporter permease [Phytohabitans flavus]